MGSGMGNRLDLPQLVGESDRMREIYALIEKTGRWDCNVCIEGENGTGKELVARALHVAGPRRDRPFVTLDCSTIPEGLIESHLFGHVRGAFTGAVGNRIGVFAQADTGTVFIDEITEFPPHLQARLLRVIQHGEFTPVGGSHCQRVDVRVITATNRNLRQAVDQGQFREDLYFRISVVHVNLPALRERRHDIPLLVAHFLRQLMRTRYPREIRGLTSAAMEALIAYDFPGNVRELENMIEQAMVLADSDLLDLEHFPRLKASGGSERRPIAPVGLTLEEVDRLYILETLKTVGGNRTKAAKSLGISLRGLQYRLRRYGVATPEPRSAHGNGAANGNGNGNGGALGLEFGRDVWPLRSLQHRQFS
jgi:two-component system, NtrC family, response regulator AtoC